MSYPPLLDIISAAKDPQFIKDPFFQRCTLNMRASGGPEMYGGGFSQVFTITKDGKKWVFKVWYKEISDNRNRYNEITAYLKKCNLPYFSDYTFVKDGLLVSGQYLDTFRMEWVEGTTLIEYISLNLKNKPVLNKLAVDFFVMTKEFHKNSLSHGDLQHDNILITKNGEIKLIDYDSICVPALHGQLDICRGRLGYQHPSRFRATAIASVNTDHFSELIIYLSIMAVIENDTLWDKHNAAYAERMLFPDYIFMDFDHSEIKKDLLLLSSKVKKLVGVLDDYLASYLHLAPFDSY